MVTISDANIVVPPSNVELGEDPGVFYLVNEVLNKGKGVSIFDGVVIDISIVLAGLEGIRGILFIHKEKGGCLR